MMKILILALAFCASAFAAEYVPGEAIVRLSEKGMAEARSESLDRVLGVSAALSAIKVFETDARFLKVRLARAKDLPQFLKEASSRESIAYAEPNYLIHASSSDEVIPEGEKFKQLWGMKSAQNADIGATKAWTLTQGSRDVVVAIVDTGINYDHEALRDNIYANPGESGEGRETNGIDDDGNGFVDDVRGWNFLRNKKDAVDDHGHGTHCAGIIGAHGENGVVGVNWHVSILPLKILDSEGGGTEEAAVKAIQYATKMKVRVMSNSWGTDVASKALFDAVKEASDAGVLFVAAAGNWGLKNAKNFPSSYPLPNIISVAASTSSGNKATFSNYGDNVHIAAPGKWIYSTYGDGYIYLDGTSMATPFVAGAAALVWSLEPELTAVEMKERLMRSREPVAAFKTTVTSGGRLNVNNALRKIYPIE